MGRLYDELKKLDRLYDQQALQLRLAEVTDLALAYDVLIKFAQTDGDPGAAFWNSAIKLPRWAEAAHKGAATGERFCSNVYEKCPLVSLNANVYVAPLVVCVGKPWAAIDGGFITIRTLDSATGAMFIHNTFLSPLCRQTWRGHVRGRLEIHRKPCSSVRVASLHRASRLRA